MYIHIIHIYVYIYMYPYIQYTYIHYTSIDSHLVTGVILFYRSALRGLLGATRLEVGSTAAANKTVGLDQLLRNREVLV